MSKIIFIISILFLFSCDQTQIADEQSHVKKQESELELDNKLNENLNPTTENNQNNNDLLDLNKEEPCDSTKCDINIVLEISENQENLTKEMVEKFLLTFDKCCGNNVEFAEFSNEMLFKVLLKRSDLFLNSYKNQIEQLDTAYINSELQSPLHDLIPLKEIIARIDSVNVDDRIKAIVKTNLEKGDW